MSLRLKLLRFWHTRKPKSLSATRVIALVFLAIIMLGTLLLSLPAASRSGVSCGFRPALFTATSATCVTGLVPFDTGTHWSGFGHSVILVMIELGGLGFMTMTTFLFMVMGRHISLRSRVILKEAMGEDNMVSAQKMMRAAVTYTFAIEGAGAALLAIRFVPRFASFIYKLY